MWRLGLCVVLSLSLATPARAEEEPPPPTSTPLERAFWIGVGGAGLTLAGGGLWLASIRWIDDANARGDVFEVQRARHLGVIGGSLAFTGLSALAVAAVLSSWRVQPLQLSIAVAPGAFSVQWVGSTF